MARAPNNEKKYCLPALRLHPLQHRLCPTSRSGARPTNSLAPATCVNILLLSFFFLCALACGAAAARCSRKEQSWKNTSRGHESAHHEPHRRADRQPKRSAIPELLLLTVQHSPKAHAPTGHPPQLDYFKITSPTIPSSCSALPVTHHARNGQLQAHLHVLHSGPEYHSG